MNCTECRDALLVADRTTLRGEGEGALTEHLRSCPDCRARALWIDGSTELLAEMYLGRRAAQPSEHVARPTRGRIAALTLLPFAAAIAGVWVLTRDTAAPTKQGEIVMAPNGVSVQPMLGQKATVIPSSNPKVTIIWLSEGDTE